MASRIEGDIQYTGNIRFSGDVQLPADVVGDSHWDADDPLAYTNQQQKIAKHYSQSGTIASATVPIHVVHGTTGGAIAIKAGSISACTGPATVTIDLKKNGTTVLTGVITLDNGNTARVMEAGTLVASPTNAAGDFYELVITATASSGTLGTGLMVAVWFYEDAA